MSPAALVEASRLTKVYLSRTTERTAVDDVSFTIGAGESLALVGESGSGKSTIARLVVGLERPTSGTVSFTGGGGGRLAAARLAQMVFQDPYSSLDPRQAVGAALSEALRLHARGGRLSAPVATRADRADRVAELLDQVGLRPYHAQLRPASLSGGQRQRVAIARALAVEPALLVLDEAVSALDVSVQAQVLNLLADIRDRTPIAYLFISHDLDVVKMLCERVIVLRDGRIVEHGPTARVLAEPEHDYTRLLLDSAPRPGWQPRKTVA
jgi:ABC-type glutathione transport system ATPase component